MLAVGCMIPFVALALGAGVGSYVGNVQGGYWGAGLGFASGLIVAVVALACLGRLRRPR